MNKSKFVISAFAAAGLLVLSSVSALAMRVDIVVSKYSQKMTVMVDGVQKYEWLVSTGGSGYETPAGNFRIFRMEEEHFSEEWDNAPMPNSMFFTGLGHAIHGSFHVKRLGTRASHGCVRLAPENAKILFALIEKSGFKNNTVTIKGGFFDKMLTTNDTFKMTPKPGKNQVQAASSSQPAFWWFRKPTTKKTTAVLTKKPAVKPVTAKPVKVAKLSKKKKKPFSIFGSL